MLSEEQWKEAMAGVTAELEGLDNLERPFTDEEKKRRNRFRTRKYVLEKIKEARDKNQKSDELYNTTYYQMLVPWGEKHPILFFFWMRFIRGRWWGVSAYNYGDTWGKKGEK